MERVEEYLGDWRSKSTSSPSPPDDTNDRPRATSVKRQPTQSDFADNNHENNERKVQKQDDKSIVISSKSATNGRKVPKQGDKCKSVGIPKALSRVIDGASPSGPRNKSSVRFNTSVRQHIIRSDSNPVADHSQDQSSDIALMRTISESSYQSSTDSKRSSVSSQQSQYSHGTGGKCSNDLENESQATSGVSGDDKQECSDKYDNNGLNHPNCNNLIDPESDHQHRIVPGYLNIAFGSSVGINSLFLKKQAILLRENGQTVSFFAHRPCLLPCSVKDNILFGHQFNESRYHSVLEWCCLNEDLQSANIDDNQCLNRMRNNLSGGQKQRIALARALYAQADIYLLDSPFSSIDGAVTSTILKKGISCLIESGSTVVIATTRTDIIGYATNVILLQPDGSIIDSGHPDDIQNRHPNLRRMSLRHRISAKRLNSEHWLNELRQKDVKDLMLRNRNGYRWKALQVLVKLRCFRGGVIREESPSVKSNEGEENESKDQVVEQIELGDDFDQEDSDFDNSQSVKSNEGEDSNESAEKDDQFQMGNADGNDQDDSDFDNDSVFGDDSSEEECQRTFETMSQRRRHLQHLRLQVSRSSITKATNGKVAALRFPSRHHSHDLPLATDDLAFDPDLPSNLLNNGNNLRRRRSLAAGYRQRSLSTKRRSSNLKPKISIPKTDEVIVIEKANLDSKEHRESIRQGDEDKCQGVSLHATTTSEEIGSQKENNPENEILLEQLYESDHPLEEKGECLWKLRRAVDHFRHNNWAHYVSIAGCVPIAVYLLVTFSWQASRVLADYQLSHFSNHSTTATDSEEPFTGIDTYLLLSLISVILSALSHCMGHLVSQRVKENIYQNMVRSLLSSKVGEVEKMGEATLTAKITCDVTVIDKKIGISLQRLVQFLLLCTSPILVNGAISPFCFLFVATLIPVYVIIQQIYRKAVILLQQMETESQGAVLSHVTDTIHALPSISYSGSGGGSLDMTGNKNTGLQFLNSLFVNKLNANTHQFLVLNSVHRWLGVTLDTVGSIVVLISSGCALIATFYGSKDPGLVGLALNYSLLLPVYLQWVVKFVADSEMYLESVRRISRDMPQAESHSKEQAAISDANHSEGLEFKNLSLAHEVGGAEKSQVTFVVKELNVSIELGEKIGICGRTGSGKTSLTMGLFNLVSKREGSILLNGVDLCQLNFESIRHAIAIAGQEPLTMPWSVRSNLDPEGRVSDTDIWSSLRDVALDEFVRQLPLGLDSPLSDSQHIGNGSQSWSLGRVQQLVMARLLLTLRRDKAQDIAADSADRTSVEIEPMVVSPEEGNNSELRVCGTVSESNKLLPESGSTDGKDGIDGVNGTGGTDVAGDLDSPHEDKVCSVNFSGEQNEQSERLLCEQVTGRVIPKTCTCRAGNSSPPSANHSCYKCKPGRYNCQLKLGYLMSGKWGKSSTKCRRCSATGKWHRSENAPTERLPKNSVLVLDESTSLMDAETESKVLDAIWNECRSRKRILLLIAHRLEPLLRCDRILVLDKGLVVQDGTPQELLVNRDGLFSAMFTQRK